MTKKKNNSKLYILLIVLIILVVGMFVLLMSLSAQSEITEPVQAAPAEPVEEPESQFDRDDPLLMLVNKDSRVDADYEPEELVELDKSIRATNRDPVTQKLTPETAKAFEELVSGASEEGLTIKLTSGYRSYAVQKKLYNYYMETKGEAWTVQYSAPPGASEHHTGLAADVSCPSISYELDESFSETGEGIWLRENAHKYGFIIRYQEGDEDITGYAYEPWHIRYVGVDAAAEIYNKDITLEEFLRDI